MKFNAKNALAQEHRYYGAPRMQDMHSKEVMLSTLSSRRVQDGYKRKKMKVTRSGTVTNASVVPSEMEVEDVEGIYRTMF